jgi:hypothetical protein
VSISTQQIFETVFLIKERDHLEDPDVDDRIIFKQIFKKWEGKARAEFVWLRIGTVAGACERCNKPLGATK